MAIINKIYCTIYCQPHHTYAHYLKKINVYILKRNYCLKKSCKWWSSIWGITKSDTSHSPLPQMMCSKLAPNFQDRNISSEMQWKFSQFPSLCTQTGLQEYSSDNEFRFKSNTNEMNNNTDNYNTIHNRNDKYLAKTRSPSSWKASRNIWFSYSNNAICKWRL